jgi:3-oxoacyl-[acyl-carrier-protein] synthase III
VNYTRIIGTGGYLPQRVLSNYDLEKMVDTNDQWIVERTGIHQRHLAAEGQGTCDMAEQAARAALTMAGVAAAELELIILATTTPDRAFPSTACLLQARLGNHGAAAFDLQAVCSGFVYALSVADKFIRTGTVRTALVIGAETFSRLVDWTDRGTCILFGDGAGAVVLRADNTPGILSTHLYADGQHSELLTARGCFSNGNVSNGDGYTVMHGSEVFKHAVNSLSEAALAALNAHQMKALDLDWLVPHQANQRIINAVAKKLRFPMERVIVTVDKHGNTSAASVPLALDTAVRDGRIQKGHSVLLDAMGGGFTWGSALLHF